MAVGNITNTIPASELPVMTEEELLANVTFVTVDGQGKMKQIPRTSAFNVISTVIQKGETGPQGPAGPRGEKGEKGDTGSPGSDDSHGLFFWSTSLALSAIISTLQLHLGMR